MGLPDDIERTVVARLYRDADQMDWAHLSVTGRAAQYAKWVQDPEVGARLTAFMSPERARVWIKDGPMKEWARASNGIGKYAAHIAEAAATPSSVVTKALGTGWLPRDGTQRIKPLRINAISGEEEVTLAWGPEKDLKHLVWAALTAGANGDTTPWVVCVTATFTKPVPSNVRLAHERLAARCGLRLVHITI